MTPEPDRRSFLSWAIFGLASIFWLLLGVPVVAYIIDPRHRKGSQGSFKLVEGIRLDEMPVDTPRQGVIRDTRTDGWTLYPNDVIGRVWVILRGPRPAGMPIETFNENHEAKAAHLLVFTTICPHLGCSVNLNSRGDGFTCPCHSAAFEIDGNRIDRPGQPNPAARAMDALEWKVDASDPNRILVKYQNYQPSKETKELIA